MMCWMEVPHGFWNICSRLDGVFFAGKLCIVFQPDKTVKLYFTLLCIITPVLFTPRLSTSNSELIHNILFLTFRAQCKGPSKYYRNADLKPGLGHPHIFWNTLPLCLHEADSVDSFIAT